MFFSIVLELLRKLGIILLLTKILSPIASFFKIPSSIIPAIISGSIEMTSGIAQLSNLNGIDPCVIYASVAFLLGIAGISVFMQTYSITYGSGLSIRPYILGKILHGTIAAIYTYILTKYTHFISNNTLEAFNYNGFSSNTIINQTSNLVSCISFLLLIGIVVKCLVLLKNFIYYRKDASK